MLGIEKKFIRKISGQKTTFKKNVEVVFMRGTWSGQFKAAPLLSLQYLTYSSHNGDP